MPKVDWSRLRTQQRLTKKADPEYDLFAAMIAQALTDLKGGNGEPDEERLRIEAWNWFHSGSYALWCELFGAPVRYPKALQKLLGPEWNLDNLPLKSLRGPRRGLG